MRDAKVPTRERFFERGGSNEGIVPCLEVSKVDEDRAVSIEGDERTSLVVEDVKSFGVELGGSKERREVVRFANRFEKGKHLKTQRTLKTAPSGRRISFANRAIDSDFSSRRALGLGMDLST